MDESDRRMKCLAIVDSYNWALYNRAKNLSIYMPNIDFDIVYFKDCKDNFDKYDVVYLLNWPIYGYVYQYIKQRRKYSLITTISSHIGRKNAKNMRSLFNKFDKVSCSNQFLYKEFYCAKLNTKLYYTPFGVNTDIFYDYGKLADPNVFGWVGNSDRPVKRFEKVKQACKEEGVILKTALHTSGYSRDKMRDFYNSIGTLICFSESEGTPNPILEAAACNRNIISTNVGNVPEINRDCKLINTVCDFNSMIKQIRIKKNKLEHINNSSFLQKWSWKEKSKNFDNFIMRNL